MKNLVVRLPIPLLPFLSLREKCPNKEFFLVLIFRIQSKCGKYGPEKTPYLDTFHAVFGHLMVKQKTILIKHWKSRNKCNVTQK